MCGDQLGPVVVGPAPLRPVLFEVLDIGRPDLPLDVHRTQGAEDVLGVLTTVTRGIRVVDAQRQRRAESPGEFGGEGEVVPVSRVQESAGCGGQA